MQDRFSSTPSTFPLATDDRQKKLNDHLATRLTRRSLLFVTGGILVAGSPLALIGCGGSGGHNSSGGGQSVGSTNVAVKFALPSGISASNLKFMNGRGTALTQSGSATVRVLAGIVSTALIYDTNAGKVVMICTIDPTSSANLIDSLNLAATLIFLKIGGNQLSGTYRNTLWKLVLADPATATFAALVKARLAANPHALNDQDSQISAGLNAAISQLQQATGAAIYPPNPTIPSQRAKPAFSPSDLRGEPLPAIPSPGVGFDFIQGSHYSQQFVRAAISVYYDGQGIDYPDLFFVQNLNSHESVYYVYEDSITSSSGATTVTSPQKRLNGPIAVGWGSGSTDVDPVLSIPLANPTDLRRQIELVYLSPIFGVAPNFGTSFSAAEVTEWSALLQAMYQRAAVRVANCLFLEALGHNGIPYGISDLKAETAALESLGGGISSAISMAAGGTDLFAAVNGLT